MLSTSKNEAFVHEAVKNGLLRVKRDGTIWRVAYRRVSRWDGAVKVVRAKAKRLAIAPAPTSGYMTVKVMRGKKQVSVGVQRLVYLHFHGPIPPGLTVNHKNGIKTDNRPENLELATYAEQVRHAREVLGHKPKEQNGEKNDMAKLTAKAVREIRRRRRAGELLKTIAADFGVSDRTISKIARGTRWAFLG